MSKHVSQKNVQIPQKAIPKSDVVQWTGTFFKRVLKAWFSYLTAGAALPLWVGSGRGEDMVKELGVGNNEWVCGRQCEAIFTEYNWNFRAAIRKEQMPTAKSQGAVQESHRPRRKGFPLRGGVHIGNQLGKGKIWRSRRSMRDVFKALSLTGEKLKAVPKLITSFPKISEMRLEKEKGSFTFPEEPGRDLEVSSLS